MANDSTETLVNITASDLAADDTNCCSFEGYNALERFLLTKPHIAAWQFFSPVIMLFGTFGNMMTIVIMRRMSKGQSSNSMSLYLTGLAVSDLITLYVGLPQVWVYRCFGIQLYRLHVSICKLIPFFTYSCNTGSTWLISVITAQRVMSVVWPHRKSLSCADRKVGLVIASIVIIVTAFNISKLFSYELNKEICEIVNDELWYYDQVIYPWIDLVVSSLIPFIILIVGNSVLVWKVIQSVQVAHVMTASGCDHVNSRQKKVSSLTVTVITISLVFLLLTLPISIYDIMASDISESETIIQWASRNFAFAVCDLAWYSHSAINFYLYCLTGSRFRNEVQSLFCRRNPVLEKVKGHRPEWRHNVFK